MITQIYNYAEEYNLYENVHPQDLFRDDVVIRQTVQQWEGVMDCHGDLSSTCS